MVSLKYGEYKT